MPRPLLTIAQTSSIWPDRMRGLTAHDGEFRAGAHGVGIVRGSERLAGSQHRDRFEQVALSLGVRADQHVEAGGRFEIELRVVPEVGERYPPEKHIIGAAA